MQLRSGDRVRDGSGHHFTVVPAAEYLPLEGAMRTGLELVDRAAYGALHRAAKSLAGLYGSLPYVAYSLMFEVVLHVVGCDATELARAVLVERMS